LEGPVFGAADKWNGVGIFFDSFDNDGKVSQKQTSSKDYKLISHLFCTYNFVGGKKKGIFLLFPTPSLRIN